MKKKMMKGLLVAMLAASLVIGMASCDGGNNPKSLAKQSYELAQQLGAISGDPDKLASLKEKGDALNAKVEKLSEAEREIYSEEFKRLYEEGE